MFFFAKIISLEPHSLFGAYVVLLLVSSVIVNVAELRKSETIKEV